MNKQITRFLQSVVALPMLALSTPLIGIPTISVPTVIQNISKAEDVSVITTPEDELRQEQAQAIDSYFASINSPLEGYGMKFVKEAEKNDIDWRLLPAIAMRESTGGKQACKKVPNSVFGYGSCKMSFKSIDHSIEIVSTSLGGNNPKTAHYYDGKTTTQILRKYNSVIPNYPQEVLSIMKKIENRKDA